MKGNERGSRLIPLIVTILLPGLWFAEEKKKQNGRLKVTNYSLFLNACAVCPSISVGTSPACRIVPANIASLAFLFFDC